MLNRIFWILCSGAPWRDLPERYGSWKTVYHRFRVWHKTSLFEQVLASLNMRLNAEGLLDRSLWELDSTTVKAFFKAASGAKKACEKDRAIGRSRGGSTTKIHLVCDGSGNGLGFLLTGGNRNDGPVLPHLLAQTFFVTKNGFRNRPNALVADKAYGSKANRDYLRKHAIKAQIPAKKLPQNHKRRQKGPKPKLDAAIYKKQNVIERLFCLIKEMRRVATRFEKLAGVFLAMIYTALICICIKKHFSDTP